MLEGVPLSVWLGPTGAVGRVWGSHTQSWQSWVLSKYLLSMCYVSSTGIQSCTLETKIPLPVELSFWESEAEVSSRETKYIQMSKICGILVGDMGYRRKRNLGWGIRHDEEGGCNLKQQPGKA